MRDDFLRALLTVGFIVATSFVLAMGQ